MRANEYFTFFLEEALNQVDQVIITDYENLIRNTAEAEKKIITGYYDSFRNGRADRKKELQVRYAWVLIEIRKAIAQGLTTNEILSMLQIQSELYRLLLYDTPEKMRIYREKIVQDKKKNE